MDISELFWNASLVELKQGYIQHKDCFICVLCGKQCDDGVVYQEEGVLYEARRYMRLHIEKAHNSVFDYLIRLDKKLTGLTEHQSKLLQLFFQGKSDTEIQTELGIGSSSTIRNHRFSLREKERQAKVFLALMEMLKEKDAHAPSFIQVHKTAKMVDDRYNVTKEENDEILNKYFPGGMKSPLKTFHLKEKHKLVVLRAIANQFEIGRIYHEKDINEILSEIYEDYVTLRRYLIEYGFLDRTPDGSQYWVKG